MDSTFTVSSDASLADLIRSARSRLVVVAPALTKTVAEVLAKRMADAPGLSLTVILDADPEVYRMGYGDTEALAILRTASAAASLRLREQEGVRIGLVISDDRTLIFSPVSRNIEAGSTSPEKPNAIMLGAVTADFLATATGAPSMDGNPDQPRPTPVIGEKTLSPDRVEAMEEDLRRTPPLPVDLTRRLNVFITRVQYVELKVKGYQISRRRVDLPDDFKKYASPELKAQIDGRIKMPLDTTSTVEVEIEWNGKKEKLKVDEKGVDALRRSLEKKFTHVFPKKGRMILRKDRDRFASGVDRLTRIIKAYQEQIGANVAGAKATFRDRLIAEFLEQWKQSPPDRYAWDQGEITDDDLRRDIGRQADALFDEMVKLEGPNISVGYKDIAIEDLKDDAFIKLLREVMSSGGLSDKELEMLFETGEATAAQGSFTGLEAAE